MKSATKWGLGILGAAAAAFGIGYAVTAKADTSKTPPPPPPPTPQRQGTWQLVGSITGGNGYRVSFPGSFNAQTRAMLAAAGAGAFVPVVGTPDNTWPSDDRGPERERGFLAVPQGVPPITVDSSSPFGVVGAKFYMLMMPS